MDDLSRPYGVEGKRADARWELLMLFDDYSGARRYREHIKTADTDYSEFRTVLIAKGERIRLADSMKNLAISKAG